MHYVYEQNGKQGVIAMQPPPAQSHQEAENESAYINDSDATQCQESFHRGKNHQHCGKDKDNRLNDNN